MTLYEIRRSRRVIISCSACGTHHDVSYVVLRNEWKALMATKSWHTDVISHSGHWDTIRDGQIRVATKNLVKCRSQSSFYETLILEVSLLTGQIYAENPYRNYRLSGSRISNQLRHIKTICRKWRDVNV